jgi:hypothetical protein
VTRDPKTARVFPVKHEPSMTFFRNLLFCVHDFFFDLNLSFKAVVYLALAAAMWAVVIIKLTSK